MSQTFDALLLVSFGGPECREDVMPFLENVTRGKNIPRERLTEVAEHYYHFGGASPINQQNREQMAALGAELAEHGPRLPIYWGNRNWHPLLPDAIRQMHDDGVQRAMAIANACGLRMVRTATVGTHPRFIRMIRELISERMEGLPPQSLGSLGPNPDVCPETCCLSGRPTRPIAST